MVRECKGICSTLESRKGLSEGTKKENVHNNNNTKNAMENIILATVLGGMISPGHLVVVQWF